MSGVLLDTHALLWFIDDHSKLSATAIQRICEPGSELFFSYAGAWEIAIKYGNGKLVLPDQPEQFLANHLTVNKIRLLPISIHSIFLAGALPLHHRDPFDRLIVAQCLRANLAIISHDAQLDAYGVQRIW